MLKIRLSGVEPIDEVAKRDKQSPQADNQRNGVRFKN
jgi:hypothetical protein